MLNCGDSVLISRRGDNVKRAWKIQAAAILTVILSGLVAHGASATSPEFAEFLKSKFNRDAINGVIRGQVQQWPEACTNVVIEPSFKVSIQQPVQITFDGSTKSISGAWIESVYATACGTKRLHHIVNVARDKKIFRSPKLVGTSLADARLQGDAAKTVAVAASTFFPAGCKSFFATDTKLMSHNPAAGATSKPWQEQWTIRACGKDVVVPIRFIPDGNGTTFAVEMHSVRAR